jgi:uncharacterized protein YueI
MLLFDNNKVQNYVKNGSLLTVKFKMGQDVLRTEYPTQVYVILHSDNIVNLTDTGVQVLD